MLRSGYPIVPRNRRFGPLNLSLAKVATGRLHTGDLEGVDFKLISDDVRQETQSGVLPISKSLVISESVTFCLLPLRGVEGTSHVHFIAVIVEVCSSGGGVDGDSI